MSTPGVKRKSGIHSAHTLNRNAPQAETPLPQARTRPRTTCSDCGSRAVAFVVPTRRNGKAVTYCAGCAAGHRADLARVGVEMVPLAEESA